MSGNNSNPDITVTMDTLSKDLQRKQLAVQDAMEELTEEDVDNVTVHTVERDLDRILERRDEFRNAVRDMLIDYGDHLEVPAQTTWKTAIASLNSEVKRHAKKIRTKAHSVLPPSSAMTEFERAQLDLQQKQLDLMHKFEFVGSCCDVSFELWNSAELGGNVEVPTLGSADDCHDGT